MSRILFVSFRHVLGMMVSFITDLVVWKRRSGRREIRRIQRSFRDSEFVHVASEEFGRSSSDGELRRIDCRRRTGVSRTGDSVNEERHGTGVFYHGEMEPLAGGEGSDVRKGARVVIYPDLVSVRVYVEFSSGSAAARVLEEALVRVRRVRDVVPSFYGHVARSEVEV